MELQGAWGLRPRETECALRVFADFTDSLLVILSLEEHRCVLSSPSQIYLFAR